MFGEMYQALKPAHANSVSNSYVVMMEKAEKYVSDE